MTIEQCYQTLGGSFAEVSMRLPSVRLVEKFIGKFLDDGSFDALCAQMSAGSREDAFRAAHTLKGVCANLGFGRLLLRQPADRAASARGQRHSPGSGPPDGAGAGGLPRHRGDHPRLPWEELPTVSQAWKKEKRKGL